jgi:hypothetical protein
LISSRFIQPNVGAILIQVRIVSSTSVLAKTIGIASTLPNCLKRIDFPSITGNPANPPILPSHKTAVPSDTTATLLFFQVYCLAVEGSLAISRHGAATHGE